MEKKLIFTPALCLLLFISHAQTFHGGLRAGLTASEVSGDHLSGPNKLGWYASVFTFTPVSPYTDLLLEIMYIQKGSRSIPKVKNNYYEYYFNLQYVEMPLLLRMDISRFTDNSVIERMSFTTGLSVSVLVDYYETDDGTTGFQPSLSPGFFPAELNFLAGLAFPLSSAMDFRIGFSNGLTPMRPHASGGRTWYNRGQYNTVWTFGLSFNIW
jgi:hypothetical protein